MDGHDALDYALPFVAASLCSLSLAVAAFALAFVAKTIDEWWRWRR